MVWVSDKILRAVIIYVVQAYLILLHFTLSHLTDVVVLLLVVLFFAFVFLQIESKTLNQQKYYGSLCHDACFIVVLLNRTHTVSEVCLCLTPGARKAFFLGREYRKGGGKPHK